MMRTLLGPVSLLLFSLGACGGSVTVVAPEDDDSSDGAAGGVTDAGLDSAGGSSGSGGSGGTAGSGGSGGSAGSGGSDIDAGPGQCGAGFCRDSVFSSCGDPQYVPGPMAPCQLPGGNAGYCCYQTCGGFGGLPCQAGQYCAYPPGSSACGADDTPGLCQIAPDACPENCPGVCGCDGQFYCNECLAHAAGQSITGGSECMMDAGVPFMEQMEGTWLVGWTGGMNHFSWVRLSLSQNLRADFLSGESITANIPFWDCSGPGSWIATAKPNTILLTFPADCGLMSESLTFITFSPAQGYPPGATLAASVELLGTPAPTVEAYKFPSSQCNATMTSCADPFMF